MPLPNKLSVFDCLSAPTSKESKSRRKKKAKKPCLVAVSINMTGKGKDLTWSRRERQRVNIKLAVKLGVGFLGFLQKITFGHYLLHWISKSKSLVCLSGLDKSSTCLRLVFWKCRQVRHRSDWLKCCLRVHLFRVSTKNPFKVLIWIFVTTTKIRIDGHSAQSRAPGFAMVVVPSYSSGHDNRPDDRVWVARFSAIHFRS